MISIQSLQEQLLPKVYVKRLSLETNYKTTTSTGYKKQGIAFTDTEAGVNIAFTDTIGGIIAPSDSMSCKISLSIKFPYNKGTGLESSLLSFLDSEYAQNYYVYIHQVTDKEVFDEFVAYNADGSFTQQTINRLTNHPTFAPHVETKKLTIEDIAKNSQYLYDPTKESKTIGLESLPLQILDDGTILSEMVSDIIFDGDGSEDYEEKISKQTNFLGYIIFSFVETEFSIGVPTDVELGGIPLAYSAVSKEIVILNGQFQDKGLIFTIAPFSPNNPNASELLQFGNPGDIWAGGVHYHEPTQAFMAGVTHSNKPHPVLDYSIVRNTKFIDNRVTEKIEKAIYDATQNFKLLNSEVASYRSNRNVLNFAENKQIPYVSDIILTQDSIGNVEGCFTLDKKSVLLNESYFKFYLRNRQFLGTRLAGSLDIEELMGLSLLTRCSVKNNGQTLATVNFAELPGFLDDKKSQVFNYEGSSPPSQTVSFTLERVNLYANAAEGDANLSQVQTFLFKHKIGSQDVNSGPTVSFQKYSVEAEYTDPTIIIVQVMRIATSQALASVQALLKYVDVGTTGGINPDKGFDTITGRINSRLIKKLKNGETIGKLKTVEVEFGETITQKLLVLDAIAKLNYKDIYSFFYSPALDDSLTFNDFVNYFYSSSNIETTTIDNLLQLQSTLEHMVNTFDLALKPVSRDVHMDNFKSYSSELNLNTVREQKTIQIKSKNEAMIRTYDHGYDFTGHIDTEGFKEFANSTPTPYRGPRNKNSFMRIHQNDYRALLTYNLTEIVEGAVTDIISGATLESIFYPNYTISVSQIAPGFLNIPALKPEFTGACVVLPSTVNTDQNQNPQTIFTSIAKLNRQIFENNKLFMDNGIHPIENNVKVAQALTEDLITLHARQGVTFPQVSQAQIVKVDQGVQNETDPNPADEVPEGDEVDQSDGKPGFVIQNTLVNFTNTSLLNSLFNKQTLNSNRKGYSFNYGRHVNELYNDKDVRGALKRNIMFGAEPIQTLCLTKPEGVDAADPVGSAPFKNFIFSDQGYIINGIIDPARLSQFFFIHQNIVRIEYLSGFKTTSYELTIPGQDNPYISNKTTRTSTNINRPRWVPFLGVAFTDFMENAPSDAEMLCRLVRHNSILTNKQLVKKFEMPFINSHFILTKSLQVFGD